MRERRTKDELILVDSKNRVVGHADKERCHDGAGIRHRALSVFLFNGRGEVLLQRRAAGKRLWPGFWSNSCCSHPRRGESVTAAARRRMEQELGIRANAKLLFRFEYQAAFGKAGSENELCAVLVARSDQVVRANPEEVAEWCWATPSEIDRRLAKRAAEHTPWMRMEWERLRGETWRRVQRYLDDG